jgi:hypothetical protein
MWENSHMGTLIDVWPRYREGMTFRDLFEIYATSYKEIMSTHKEFDSFIISSSDKLDLDDLVSTHPEDLDVVKEGFFYTIPKSIEAIPNLVEFIRTWYGHEATIYGIYVREDNRWVRRDDLIEESYDRF